MVGFPYGKALTVSGRVHFALLCDLKAVLGADAAAHSNNTTLDFKSGEECSVSHDMESKQGAAHRLSM